MRIIHRRGALGLLVATLTIVAGCGGGGSDDEVASPALDTRLNTDPAGAELSQTPTICCDGNHVYVAWSDRRDGGLDIRFNRSLDWGQSWLATDLRLDTDAIGAAGSTVPALCCNGNNVYACWHDERNGFGDIYFNVSRDAGASFLSSDIRLDTSSIGSTRSREPQICCAGDTVYVVWEDNRNGGWDIYFNRSLDGGTTWLASDVRINTDAAGADNARSPQIACVGTTVFIAWEDERDGGNDVRFSRSLDRGATWSTSDTRINVGTAAGGFVTSFSLRASGNVVAVAWGDMRSGMADIYVNRSANQGATWFLNDVRVNEGTAGANHSHSVDTCMFADQLYVVWADDRNGLDDIYFNRSLDGGVSWIANDIRLESDTPGAYTSTLPTIACDQDRVSVAWYDNRFGAQDIFLNHSPDRGGSWLIEEERVDDDPAGSGHSLQPKACSEGSRVWVTWTDQRDGPGDVYLRAADFGTLGI